MVLWLHLHNSMNKEMWSQQRLEQTTQTVPAHTTAQSVPSLISWYSITGTVVSMRGAKHFLFKGPYTNALYQKPFQFQHMGMRPTLLHTPEQLSQHVAKQHWSQHLKVLHEDVSHCVEGVVAGGGHPLCLLWRRDGTKREGGD